MTKTINLPAHSTNQTEPQAEWELWQSSDVPQQATKLKSGGSHEDYERERDALDEADEVGHGFHVIQKGSWFSDHLATLPPITE